MKSAILLSFALVLVATLDVASQYLDDDTGTVFAGSGQLGDANCNGDVNAIDAAIALQYTAGLLQSVPCSGNGDVNSDGEVTSVDASLILQFAAGLLNSLTPGDPIVTTPTPTDSTENLVYRGTDTQGLGGEVEVIVSADGMSVERFTLAGLCRIGPDDDGDGVFFLYSTPVRFSGSFSYAPYRSSVKVHGAFSVEGLGISGQAWTRAPCAMDNPVSWVAYLQS